jgi:anti-sigma factor RsiW
MNCDHFKNELEDFLYGELGEARAAEMRAHLGNCAACAAVRDEIDRENDIFGRFYEQTSIEPAAEMWQSIRARINSEDRERPRVETDRGLPGLSALLDRLRAARLPFGPAALRQAAFAALLVVLSVAATTIYLKLGEKKEANNLANEKAGL